MTSSARWAPSLHLRRPVRSLRRSGAARTIWTRCSATGSGSPRLVRELLPITAFRHPHDYGEHFKAHYGPTIAARANAERNGRAAEFDAALDAFCDEWNRGDNEKAYFEKEYLVAVGRRT